MKAVSKSALRRQATDTLRRARATPIGTFRNDLRQLAQALLALERLQATGCATRQDKHLNSARTGGDHA